MRIGKWISGVMVVSSLGTSVAGHAADLGEAVDSLSPSMFAALADASPAALSSVAETSNIASAWRAGTMTTEDALVAATDSISRLAEEQGRLNSGHDTATMALALLSARVMTGEVQRLLDSAQGSASGEQLASAMAAWASGLTLPAADQVPAVFSPCWGNFGRCFLNCTFASLMGHGYACRFECWYNLQDCIGDPRRLDRYDVRDHDRGLGAR